MEIFRFFSDYINWLILGIFLVFIEILLPGAYVIWFGLAALVMGGVVALLPLSVVWQLALFALLSLISVLIGLRVYGSRRQNQPININKIRGSEYIGRHFTLETPVVNGEGRLRLGDSSWIIKGEDCAMGTQIKIVKVSVNTLHFIIIQLP